MKITHELLCFDDWGFWPYQQGYLRRGDGREEYSQKEKLGWGDNFGYGWMKDGAGHFVNRDGTGMEDTENAS